MSYEVCLDANGASLVNSDTAERDLGLSCDPEQCREVLLDIDHQWGLPYLSAALTDRLRRHHNGQIKVVYSAYPMLFEPDWVFDRKYQCAS